MYEGGGLSERIQFSRVVGHSVDVNKLVNGALNCNFVVWYSGAVDGGAAAGCWTCPLIVG